jgi:DNA replication protein DnaC
MPYDGKLLARAREQLEKRRAANQAEQQRRLAAAYARVPEIQRIDQTMRAQMAELVRLTISRKPDLAQEIERLKEENLDLQVRRAELLTEQGWPIDFLDEICSCPKCRDTGIFNGAPCECLHKLYNQELTKELGVLLRSGNESFENFDLKLYSDAPNDSGISPRKHMEQVYIACQKFASNFPDVSSNLLLQGGTGLGKTYLSACVARVVAAKGFSVCYDSASAALEAFERQKFSRDAEEAESAARRVRRMLSCDLMILDDLGTEMLTPFSTSALYTLLNTRLVNRSRTIISTNCGAEELQRRYPPQICSRLDGEFLRLPFVGSDIRRLLRES